MFPSRPALHSTEPLPDDEALFLRSGRDCRESFVEIVRRWQRPVLKFFLLLGQDRDGAEDSAQETFLRLYAYRARYRSAGAPFRAFLFHVARHVAADGWRRSRRRDHALRLVPLEPEMAFEPAARPAADHGAALDVRAALACLSEKHRLVVVLNVFEGLDYGEIAAALELPVGTVKSRMFHALRKLREVLHAHAPL